MFRKRSINQFKRSSKLWFILFTLSLIFLSVVHSFASIQVSLEWKPNSEADLAGYRVFSREEGKSYDYNNPIWEGTNNYCTIDNLNETKDCFFVTRAFNTQGFESGDSNEVCLESAPGAINQPPTSNAGPDQIVEEKEIITLDGSNSTDPDDGIADYHWVQTGGPNATLSNPNSKVVTFTAPDIGQEGISLTFELTVEDHSGLISTDSCVVNIIWLNEPPQANAGSDQTENEGVVITLDGSSSIDIDDGIASYLWTQISGPEVIIYDSTSDQPTFTAPDVGPEGASLAFNLTVTDTGGLQDSDSCIVNISWQNKPPTAILEEDYIEVPEGTKLTLDGSKSTDADDGIVSYLWTQVDGKAVTLSDPVSKITTFIAPETDENGTNLTFKLTVTDSEGLKDTADCLVYVTDANESYYKPLTLEAEDMPIKTTGGAISDGWNIWSNGYLADDIAFPTKGTYTFEIRAKGVFAGNAWPNMELRIDQKAVGTVRVNSSEWAVYTIEAPLESGTHEVAVAFTNDYYKQSEDRNLYVDKVTIYFPDKIESYKPVTLEAENMPIKTTGGAISGGWNIWSNGYLADDIAFPTKGTYTFEIRAKGVFAGNAWPNMELRIDQKAVGTVTVNFSEWAVYTIEAPLESGTHEVAVAFTNDYYKSPEDRNLYMDKITLTTAGNSSQ